MRNKTFKFLIILLLVVLHTKALPTHLNCRGYISNSHKIDIYNVKGGQNSLFSDNNTSNSIKYFPVYSPKNIFYASNFIGLNLGIGEDYEFISDTPIGANLNSPSKRKKEQWSNNLPTEDENQEIDEAEEISEYKSAIKKIREIERENEVKNENSWISELTEQDYVEIYLAGGGFINEMDPRMHDQIMINNVGHIETNYESEIGGIVKSSRNVDKDDVVDLVKWIADKGFFSFNMEYICPKNDAECNIRLMKQPQPIPLRIVVAAGIRRNVITIPIYGPNIEKDYIEFPKEIKQIVEAIYFFTANNIETKKPANRLNLNK